MPSPIGAVVEGPSELGIGAALEVVVDVVAELLAVFVELDDGLGAWFAKSSTMSAPGLLRPSLKLSWLGAFGLLQRPEVGLEFAVSPDEPADRILDPDPSPEVLPLRILPNALFHPLRIGSFSPKGDSVALIGLLVLLEPWAKRLRYSRDGLATTAGDRGCGGFDGSTPGRR
jgi:hypothetical protein